MQTNIVAPGSEERIRVSVIDAVDGFPDPMAALAFVADDAFELSVQALLGLEIFNNGFDHNIHAFKTRVIKTCRNIT